MINSYPSIYNLGHSAIADLLKAPVIVEEKIDGSQISFCLEAQTGEIAVRSKGAQINVVSPEGMFKRGVESVETLKPLLKPDWTYRGEYLNAPHHNGLTYDRVPKGNIIIFDINPALETYLSPQDKAEEAARIGLECVPVLYQGIVADVNQFRNLLDTNSVLGGQKIEGVVIKPADYALFGKDKKCLMGKFVSEAFREVQSKAWESEHKTRGPQEILAILAATYGTAGRWGKAEIHLREKGLLTGDLKDIGLLMKEVPEDVEKECADQIKDDLFKWAWPQLRRMLNRGLPEWYKERVMLKAFEK